MDTKYFITKQGPNRKLPHTVGATTNNELINNRITALELTAAEAVGVCVLEGGGGGGLNKSTVRIFALNSAVIKPQMDLVRMDFPYLCNVSAQKYNQFKRRWDRE